MPKVHLIALTATSLIASWIWFADGKNIENNETEDTVLERQQSAEQLPDAPHHPFATRKASSVGTNLANSDVVEFNQSSTACTAQCGQIIELIRKPSDVSDEEYEQGLGNTADLVAHLRANPALRDELIELAVLANTGQRQLIISAFAQLEQSQRQKLGYALLDSRFLSQRLDGVSVLSDPENIDNAVVQEFTSLLAVEQDSYIQEALVRGLDNADNFSGNQDVLAALSLIRSMDVNASVRGKALITSVHLSNDPEEIFTDSIGAIRSKSAEYQFFGVQALEEIITRVTLDDRQLGWQSDSDVRQLLDELMTPDYDDFPDDLRRSIDNIAERFF